MNKSHPKKITLASASRQRRKLLKMLGIPFLVCPSRIQESRTIKTTCAAFVKENALRKAKDIVPKTSSEIIIGADTVVYIGNKKIIGKPRNIKDAKRILRILMARPRWIYTGLAVINKGDNRFITDYEKTKVTMVRLSNCEIDRYYQHISPMDKAGGFDIEGRGSLFIRRIEGCYTNVIGLPMTKLVQMLKKVGCRVLCLLLISSLTGCVTEYNLATQRQETLIYGTEKEIKLGESLARQLERRFKVVNELGMNTRISKIKRKLSKVCDRKELVYTVKIITGEEIKEEINAISLPGGFVYVFKNLVDQVDNDDQLACVIAHEIGHITAKHGIKRLQGLYGYSLLQLISVGMGTQEVSQGLNAAFLALFTEHSQKDEFEADRLAVKYVRKAGYDSSAMIGFLKKLREMKAYRKPRPFSYFRTHPYITQRIAALNQAISGKIEFRDYLNLTGEDK